MARTSSKRHSQSGSVIFVLMIGIAIFAALSYAVTASLRTGTGTTDNVELDKAALDATAVNDFVQSVRNGVQQMKNSGIEDTLIDFMDPANAGYNTAPHEKKIFHPAGGGVGYVAVWPSLDDSTQATATAWHFLSNPVDGIGSASGAELLMTLMYVPEKTCKQLNKSLTGTASIPTVVGTISDMFVTGLVPMTAANCAACEGKTAMCVEKLGIRAFYYVLDRG